MIDIALQDGCGVRLFPASAIEHQRWQTLRSKEPETISWIDTFEPGAVFLDVGANVGVYSVYALLRHPGMQVISLEPEPVNFMRLVDNLQRTRSALAKAYPFAASDGSGLGLLHRSSPGDAGASQNQLSSHDDSGVVGCITVTLDEFVEKLGAPFPSYIKIDVDGIEPQIVKGMAALMNDQRLRSVLVESQNAEMTYSLDNTFNQANFRLVSRPDLFQGNRIYNRID